MMSVGDDRQQVEGNMVCIDHMADCVAVFRSNLLSERFDAWSESDVNLIFIHYVMGLVMSVCGQSAPQKQIHFIQRLAELEISREEAVSSLHAVPPGGRGGLARAVEAAEQAGRHDGEDIKKPTATLRRTMELGAF
ncbi:hypothetical protein [Roseixanthobacter glucoisosaccharinicivorans]|uniref:hypothetical protein n=1 Tax=Roseixanthobacter glucoisosaccharinicivorans TaxID=3119923 RepID=UPI00372BE4B2